MMCCYTRRPRASICLRTAQGIDRRLHSQNVLVAQTCLFGYSHWFFSVPGFWAASIFGIYDRNSFAFGLWIWMETWERTPVDGITADPAGRILRSRRPKQPNPTQPLYSIPRLPIKFASPPAPRPPPRPPCGRRS
jgi:hypothetical protein